MLVFSIFFFPSPNNWTHFGSMLKIFAERLLPQVTGKRTWENPGNFRTPVLLGEFWDDWAMKQNGSGTSEPIENKRNPVNTKNTPQQQWGVSSHCIVSSPFCFFCFNFDKTPGVLNFWSNPRAPWRPPGLDHLGSSRRCFQCWSLELRKNGHFLGGSDLWIGKKYDCQKWLKKHRRPTQTS